MLKFLFVWFHLFFIVSIVCGTDLNDSCHHCQLTEYTIEIVSGNNQHTRSGNPFNYPLKVRIYDSINQPAVNFPIHFLLLNQSGTEVPDFKIKDPVYTDSMGMAAVHIDRIKESGDYEILVTCSEKAHCNPQLFELHVRRANWVFILIIGLSGGLALFLFGMSMMSEGMQNSAGNRMRSILSKLTHNRFVALGLGALVTMVIQSSSATNVMLISFVNSKLMRFRQTIGVMLGAAIGTTITAQIIAFKLTDYALLFVATGLAIQYMGHKQGVKEIGKAILGFGILFYGMYVMSESMHPLRTYDPFLQIIVHLQNPAIGILIGALLTALIQSSSAFIGILIILSMQGLLTLNAAIPLLIGANVGTSVTAILASLNGSREAKQVALAHTLFKITGAVIFVFFIPSFIRLIHLITYESTTTGINQVQLIASPRQIANAHTIYNIVLCSLFIPITNTYSRFINWIYPTRFEEEEPFKVRYLDNNLLKTPVLAINVARLELVRMIKKVYYMTEKIIRPFLDKKSEILHEIEYTENEINFLRDRIVDYLIKITQNNLAADITQEAFMMMNAVREFEQIADINSHQLMEKAYSWCNNPYQFSQEGKNEIIHYHEHTLNIIIQSLKVFEDFDLKTAKRLRLQYNQYREEYFELEQQHYDRLKDKVESTISSSKTHLEIITLLRVISSHAMNTSRIIIFSKGTTKKNKTHEPDKSTN